MSETFNLFSDIASDSLRYYLEQSKGEFNTTYCIKTECDKENRALYRIWKNVPLQGTLTFEM